MQSSVIINNGNGSFTRKGLPTEAQLSPMYGISAGDFDDDGKIDIMMGGNFHESKPEAGIYDASYGVLLKGNGKGDFTALTPQKSGILVKGAIRDMIKIQIAGKEMILFARNNKTPVVLLKR